MTQKIKDSYDQRTNRNKTVFYLDVSNAFWLRGLANVS